MNEFWNQRYAENETVYGKKPNAYFKLKLDALNHVGTILLPAEGEGRNAIYAASKGWAVTAFDYSETAKVKALTNARLKNVQLDYTVVDIHQYQVTRLYDTIGLIYVHLPPADRIVFHQKIIDSLAPGAMLIIEAFSKEQIHNQSGGPKVIEQLYSIAELRHDFESLDMIELEEIETELDEGPFHQGSASVIRLFAKKPL
jgi:2-polyprenyl-3-methyl-5-hydroxy-6-metoxy-1,4-benzoquinol methylase